MIQVEQVNGQQSVYYFNYPQDIKELTVKEHGSKVSKIEIIK